MSLANLWNLAMRCTVNEDRHDHGFALCGVTCHASQVGLYAGVTCGTRQVGNAAARLARCVRDDFESGAGLRESLGVLAELLVGERLGRDIGSLKLGEVGACLFGIHFVGAFARADDDGDLIAEDFSEAAVNRKVAASGVGDGDDFTAGDEGHERQVSGEDIHFAELAG